MSTPEQKRGPVAPDSLVALVPVSWDQSELPILEEVHPQIWAEALLPQSTGPAVDGPAAVYRAGLYPADITIHVDEPIPELAELAAAAKHPFDHTEQLLLNEHRAIWRFTMEKVSEEPLVRARAFSRLLATAMEAGAPGVFLPACFQLHPSQLVRHLANDLDDPQTLTNLYVSAFNDDNWMVTRGLTLFGLPELETPVDDGLNSAYFRLLDVATAMLVQEDPFRDGSQVQLGAHLFEVQPGPAGPEDKAIAVCGAFGRLTLRRAALG